MSTAKPSKNTAAQSDRAKLMSMLKTLSADPSLENSKIIYTHYLDRAIELFRSEPSILEVNTKNAVLVGDLHGDTDTFRKITKHYPPTKHLYVLGGDYVDRSKTGTELLALILAHKLVYKDNFLMLRGDHESPIGEFNPQLQVFDSELFWKLSSREIVEKVYDQLFTELPMAVVLNRKYFIVHGGIPVGCPTIAKLRAIGKSPMPKAITEVDQMMWNDPSDTNGATGNVRGSRIYCFGPDLARRFLEKNGLDLIIRGHDHTLGGFALLDKTVTITSTTSYSGGDPYVGVLRNGNLEVYNLSTPAPFPIRFSALVKLERKSYPLSTDVKT